jgi:hypothetical protein
LSFKPAWRFIVKNFNNDNLQLFYFQSGEDFLCDYQRWKRITQQFPTSKHIINYPRGYHILFLEENNQVNIQLFNDILARV